MSERVGLAVGQDHLDRVQAVVLWHDADLVPVDPEADDRVEAGGIDDAGVNPDPAGFLGRWRVGGVRDPSTGRPRPGPWP